METNSTIKDFRAKVYDEEKIILLDRRKISALMDEIKSERNFTITYQDDDEWVTELVISSMILAKFNNGSIQLGGLVTESEQNNSGEDW